MAESESGSDVSTRLLLATAILISAAVAAQVFLRGGTNSVPDTEQRHLGQPVERVKESAGDSDVVQLSIADEPAEPNSPSTERPKEIFMPVDEQVLRRLAPSIDEKLEHGVTPMGYLSHRIVEIDTEELQRALRRSLQASSQGKPEIPVSVPVLANRSVDVVITQWTEGNFGIHIAWGSVASLTTGRLSRFRFNSTGKMQAVIKTSERNYLIEAAPLPPYYVIYESKIVDAEM